MRFSFSILFAFAMTGLASATYGSQNDGGYTPSNGGGYDNYGGHNGGGGGYTPTPSSSYGGGYQCPDSDTYGNSWDEGKCDKPPYKSQSIGCSFHNGKGTGLVQCVYDAVTGDSLSSLAECPGKALLTSEYKKRKRAAIPAPPAPPTPAGLPLHNRIVKKRASQYAY